MKNVDIRREIDATHRRLGTRERETGTARLVTLSRTYPTDVEDLWAACTDPARLGRWFLPVHGDLHVGGRYQLEGQAGGTITACEAPHALDATWEYGGDVSWIELRLSPDGDGARLDLTHVFHPDDEHWPRYGPAATGIGWDLGLVGLAWHLGDGGTPHGESEEWAASPEGVAFLTAVGAAWVPVTVDAGLDPDDAKARADRTVAFFTGAE
ncbi:SRPBCC family protein [Actinomycetospora callitridis]|uniref:SRPBCC family protein n=1 Tax=Actinomycetospora callitridis TaxID=913944 RepID=UPI002365756E|nr:SRPBCC family protein [Actinomycetospora callitridis]MDD7921008.1 SRPBCC family protein [Actinomycetospora callitridis]